MAPVDDGMEKGPTHQGGDPQTRAKPLKRWLKDSRLYMVSESNILDHYRYHN